MGIPAFYRWLVDRYPRSVVDVVAQDSNTHGGGGGGGIDATKPNPNGLEFDNFYLDMNAIIHPCFHPDGSAAPESFDDVFNAVFNYIDALFAVVRPRKLLYMAIDGVAPRAKMNQQRSRRFRTAKDVADQASKAEASKGDYSPEVQELKENKLDSNIITPGTEFMELLSSALHYYIHLKINSDPGWREIKVILSDASVPGEGEHKVISFIRLQRNLPGFDPNTRHCMYGLDADLIMLALATHEIHFSILREDVRRTLPNDKDSQQGLTMSSNGEGYVKHFEDFLSNQRFQFLHIWILRDYLAHELRIPDPKVKFDLDRLIDDFVFMCLFVGNDFLPHVPSLEISEGAIDLLMMVYKKEFSHMGGYLTNSSEVDLGRVEHFVQALGSYESAIFRKRAQAQKEWETRLRHSTFNTKSKGVTKWAKVAVETIYAIDKVKLGEEDWKKRYYSEKFEVGNDEEIEGVQKHAVSKYVEGICWVMHYYYQGICSWQWYYPYHYAPFASDFNGLQQFEISFNLGKPFKPFDQLMAVLPAASAQALPACYRKLMTDPLSPILDFYPTDFELDMNGKRHAWQAVCKLPFIDELLLLTEIRKVEHTLMDEEKRRNSLSLDVLFFHSSHRLAAKIFSFCKRNKNNPKLLKAKVKRKIDPAFSDGINGYICISSKPVQLVELDSPVDGMESIIENNVVSVFYKPPAFHPHIPRVLEGGVMHARSSVSNSDIQPPPILWHEKTALVQQRRSQRPLPSKSISGRHLAKLAHQLVVQKCGTGVSKKREGDWPEHNNTMNQNKKKIRNKLRKLNKA